MARSFRKTRSLSRRGQQKWGQIGLIAGAVVLVAVLIYIIFFTGLFHKTESFVPLGSTGTFEIAASDTRSIYHLQGSTLHKLDAKGKVLWSAQYTQTDLALAVGRDVICLYNKETATILDTAQNPLVNIPKSEFTIHQVVCGNNSVALLSTIEGSATEYIRVFNMEGIELHRYKVENTKVLKMGFFDESDNLWYLTLDVSGVAPISRIFTASPAQQNLTANYEIYGQLVSDACFWNTDIYISDTHALTAYDTFNTELSQTRIYGTKLIDTHYTKDDLFFAYVPVNNAENMLGTVRVISKNGSDTLIQLPSGIYHVALSDKYIYCFGENAIYLYHYDGKYAKGLTLDFSVASFQKLCDNLVLLRTDEDSFLYKLA